MLSLLAASARGEEPSDPVASEAARIASRLDAGRLKDDIKLLSGLGSRLAGSDGATKASRIIAERLLELGLRDLSMSEFPVLVPIDKGFELRPEGTPAGSGVRCHGLWPNLVRTPTVAGDGLTGRMIYVRDGRIDRFDGHDIEGAIVLMDFESSSQWLTAAMLGAKAVVFLEARNAVRRETEEKYLQTVPLPLPRVYLSREALVECCRSAGIEVASADELLGRLAGPEWAPLTVTLSGRMDWEERSCYNVEALIPGTDDSLNAGGPDEEVVISAYYDSFSVVPSIAPGAEAACGAAALLEIARLWSESPPRRPVRLLFTSGHFRALAGMRHWVQRKAGDRRRALAREEIEKSDYGGPGALYFGLDLSSRSRQVGLFFKGHYYDQTVTEGESKLRKQFYDTSDLIDEVVKKLPATVAPEGSFVNGIRSSGGRDWWALLHGPSAFDAECYSAFGGQGMTLATTRDGRAAVGTPLDEPEAVDIAGLAAQSRFIASTLWSVVSSEDLVCKRLGDRFDGWTDLLGKLQGETLIDYLPGRDVEGGIVAYRLNYSKSISGVRGMIYARSGKGGRFYIPGCVPSTNRNQWKRIWGFVVDDETGYVTHTCPLSNTGNQRAARGRTKRIDRHLPLLERRTDTRLPMFECVGTFVYDLVDPLYSQSLTGIDVLDARSNSRPRTVMYYLGESSLGSGYSEPCGAAYTYRGDPVKFVLTAGKIGKRMVVVNTDEKSASTRDEDMAGAGFATNESENFVYRTSYRAARDMHSLDKERLEKLSECGIRNRRAERLHEDAGKLLADAEEHLKAKRYSEFLDNARGAWALEAQSYPEIRATTSDVVRGLIFYFALLLPFCYFAERLFFGHSDIRARLGIMGGVFGVIYLILWTVHPAFQVSKTPIIILQGFLMAAMAVVVVYMLLDRFNIQMRFVRDRISAHHSADIARGGAMAVSFALGVSNMRKRKLRTVLTCITLVLLMFTILSFTSFQTEGRLNRTLMPLAPPYQGVLIRKVDWGPIEKSAAYSVANHFLGKGEVSIRRWLMSAKRDKRLEMDVALVGEGEGAASFAVQAVLGVEPGDGTIIRDAVPGRKIMTSGRFIDTADADERRQVALVSERMASVLGIALDGKPRTIRILGTELAVVGVFNAEAMSEAKDLDGEPLVPVDYITSKELKQEQEKQRTADAAAGTGDQVEVQLIEQYEHLDPSVVLIVPSHVANALGATPRAISVRAKTPAQADELVNHYVPRSMLVLFGGVGSDTRLYSTRGALSVKGLSSVTIPFAIAGLMVLNVMLGSVYERLREISIFSSIGLAPLHVGALFLAESCVYASIGAIFGYLLGQIVAKVVTSYDLFVGITLNYSSTSAVVATFLTAAVVIISTLFPAKKAADYAVPDQTRKLSLPRPDGDHWFIPFPFTVSSREALGLNAYLHEFIAGHDEDTTGRFSTADVELRRAGEGVYELSGRAWLTPLDSGISQRVKFVTRPTADEPLISEIEITLDRLSGEIAAWRRLNPGFIVAVRKQFLIWRLVDPEDKAEFEKAGRRAIGLDPAREDAPEETLAEATAVDDEGGL